MTYDMGYMVGDKFLAEDAPDLICFWISHILIFKSLYLIKEIVEMIA